MHEFQMLMTAVGYAVLLWFFVSVLDRWIRRRR